MGITAAGVSAAAALASAAVGTVGAVESGQAQSRNARYQAQVAANNATVANQNAALATQEADAKAQADYRAGAIKLGAQRAALAANGGDINSGSAASVQANTAANTQMGVDNSLWEGSLQSYGLRTQAGNYTAQAGLDQTTAGQDAAAGDLKGFTTLASGASQFASKWNQYTGTPSSPASGGGSSSTAG